MDLNATHTVRKNDNLLEKANWRVL